MRAYELGFEKEKKFGACSQMVLTTVQELLGTIDDSLIKASHSLAGGGAGCEDGTCGALAGGLLAIGSEFGRDVQKFGEDVDATYKELGKILHDRFVNGFGSVVCSDVREKIDSLPVEIGTGDAEKEILVSDCTGVVGVTGSWSVEILINKGIYPL